MIVLKPSDYPRLGGLLQNLAVYNVILGAVINDTSPAWVVADQLDQPTATLLFTAEGAFLAGDAGCDAFVADLRVFFQRAETEPGYWQGGEFISLWLGSPDWEARLPVIFPRRQPAPHARQHYTCTALGLTDWRDRLAAGYTIERINAAFLDRPGMDIPEHIPSWMGNNWESIEDFEANGGFAFGAIYDSAVVSWCVADAAAGDRCEIGIQTRPDYRRRGLASLVTAAAVDYALSCGFREVGWHCNADNAGSIGTALKAGFQKERDYTAYWYEVKAGG